MRRSGNGINSAAGASLDNGARLNVGDTFNIYQSGNKNQCLRGMFSSDPRDDKRRIERAKGGLLDDSYRWILDNREFRRWLSSDYAEQQRLLWINGDAGKGKTMLLCGIIDSLINSTRLQNDKEAAEAAKINLSFFFCQQTDERINTGSSVLRGLLYLLIRQQPELISHVLDRYDTIGDTLFTDANAFDALSTILARILSDEKLKETWFFIDALDECTTDKKGLLSLIVDHSNNAKVKWIVTNRHLPAISERFQPESSTAELCLELNHETVAAAVRAYIRFQVQQLAKVKHYSSELQTQICCDLEQKAGDTFLWVALVCNNLKEAPAATTRRTLKSIPSDLNKLYHLMMKRVEGLNKDDAQLCKTVLAIATVAYRPVSIAEWPTLLPPSDDLILNARTLGTLMQQCGSFLRIQDEVVYFVHQSAKDFLEKDARSLIFPDGAEQVHCTIASHALEAMRKDLKRDPYNLKHPASEIKEIEDKPQPKELERNEYVCLYWVDHVVIASEKSKKSLEKNGEVDRFLRSSFLYWLESLSYLDGIYPALASLSKLVSIIQRSEPKGLSVMITDAYYFLGYFRSMVKQFPLQIYASGLLFCPSRCFVRERYSRGGVDWVSIVANVAENWEAHVRTLDGSQGRVSSASFSIDRTWLVHGTLNNKIQVSDVTTGQCIHEFGSTWGWDPLLALSPDKHTLAMVSIEGIWVLELKSGRCQQGYKWWQQFILPTAEGLSVAFSTKGDVVAAAVDGDELSIWSSREDRCTEGTLPDGLTAESVTVIPGSAEVFVVASAKVGKCHVLRYSQAADQPEDLFQSQIEKESGVQMYSAQKDLFALLETHNEVAIWGPGPVNFQWERKYTITVAVRAGSIRAVALSPNAKRLALYDSSEELMKIWDLGGDTPYARPDLARARATSVKSLALSPDNTGLVITGYDSTIEIHNLARSGLGQKQWQGRRNTPLASRGSFSSCGRWFAAFDRNGTLYRWDTSSGDRTESQVSSGLGLEQEFGRPVFSPDAGLIGATIRAYRSAWKIVVYNISTCESYTITPNDSENQSLHSFSPDNSWMVTRAIHGSEVELFRLSPTSAESCCLLQLSGDSGIAFSLDSSLLILLQYQETEELSGWTRVWTGRGYSLHQRCWEEVLLKDVSDDMWKVKSLISQGPDTWVCWRQHRVLWLPPEYRQYFGPTVAHGSTIATDSENGLVFIHFTDPDSHLAFRSSAAQTPASISTRDLWEDAHIDEDGYLIKSVEGHGHQAGLI